MHGTDEGHLLRALVLDDLFRERGFGFCFFRLFLLGLRIVVEAVPEASDGANEGRVGGIGFDLLPEPEDIHVNGSIGYGAIMAPDGVEQLFAAEDHTRAAHQELEQTKLGSGQSEEAAVKADFATASIELKARG